MHNKSYKTYRSCLNHTCISWKIFVLQIWQQPYKFPGQLRLKLFQQPQVQAFVAWVEEEDDEEEDSEDEEEDEWNDDDTIDSIVSSLLKLKMFWGLYWTFDLN